MRVLVDIGHPAGVHFFKNLIWKLEDNGHAIEITATDKDVVLSLLENYGFKYKKIADYRERGVFSKAIHLPLIEYKMLRIARTFKPDVFIGWGSIFAAHVSKFVRRPCIIFEDNEGTGFLQKIYLPFTDIICTSTSFQGNYGKKHIRYNSFESLAYLHNRYFVADASVLDELGIDRDEKYIIVRLVSWEATHDIGHNGFNFKSESDLLWFINKLEKYGKVFISSERKLSPSINKYLLPIPSEKIHNALYFAQMYIGEGGTMAEEAAILGVPSIFVSSIKHLGYINELRDTYGLVLTSHGFKNALAQAERLFKERDLKKEWLCKSQTLINGKIDLTQFMLELVEGFPNRN